jgi:hypothetical protein
MTESEFLARYGEQYQAFLHLLQQNTPMLEAVGDLRNDSLPTVQLEEALERLPGWLLRKAGWIGERKLQKERR